MENVTRRNQLGKMTLRVAPVSLALLMVPLVASRFVEGWHWNAGSFVFVYFLFFAIGMVYMLIAKRMAVWSYKAGVAIALVTGFATGWSTMVQTADSGHPERNCHRPAVPPRRFDGIAPSTQRSNSRQRLTGTIYWT